VKPYVVIDGHSLIYKNLYVKGPRLYSRALNEATTGTYYFVRSLFALVRRFEPSHLLFAYDGEKSWPYRRRIFGSYKANRDTKKDRPKEILAQLERCHQIVGLLGIPKLAVVGYEADDVIATVVREGRVVGAPTIVVSSDKDLRQLISDKDMVTVYDHKQVKTYDEEAFFDEYGFGPGMLLDYLSLMGDSSDNIPGVRGVGPKAALELVRAAAPTRNLFSTRDGILGVLRKAGRPSKGALARKLLSGTEAFDLSRRLVDLQVCTDKRAVDPAQFVFRRLDVGNARQLFTALGFKRLGTVQDRQGEGSAGPIGEHSRVPGDEDDYRGTRRRTRSGHKTRYTQLGFFS
jgi:DNA polymerase-1